MYADTTVFTIQSNKFVSNEDKTTKHYYSYHMGKAKQTFWPTQLKALHHVNYSYPECRTETTINTKTKLRALSSCFSKRKVGSSNDHRPSYQVSCYRTKDIFRSGYAHTF